MFKLSRVFDWMGELSGARGPCRWGRRPAWLLLLSLAWSLAWVGQSWAQPQPAGALRQRLAAVPNDTGRVRVLNQLAKAYLFQQPDSGWFYAGQARELAQQLGDEAGLFEAYTSLGIFNGIRGNDEASLRFFLAQLRLADHTPQVRARLPAVYSNIAHSYLALSRYSEALTMLGQARRLDEQAHDTAGVVSDLGNIAEIEMSQGRAQASLGTITEALRLRRRYHPHPAGYPSWGTELQLADALLRLGRYAAARDTLLAIRPLQEKHQLVDELANTQRGLLVAYRHLGQPAAAERAGQAALAYARQARQLTLRRDVLTELAGLAASQQHFAMAYARGQLAARLTDSLSRASNAKTVQDLQFRYETERREAQLRELAQESDRRRWQMLLWAGLAGLALLALALVYLAKRLQTNVFARRESLLTQERERSEALQLLREATTQALQLELDTNQREMTSATLFAQQKTKLLENLTASLEALSQRVPEPEREAVAELKRAIRQHLQVGDDWERITLHFGKIHPSFFEQLRRQCPALTPNELKQCAYVKLNLTNKDIANLVNIEPNSVKIAQYRIKKKLGLPEESSLRDYILSV